LKSLNIRVAVNFSKAQFARSNRAGQAKSHIASYKSRLVDCVRHWSNHLRACLELSSPWV